MRRKYSDKLIRELRNEIDVRSVITEILDVPNKVTDGTLRFLCPRCSDFHTAINPNTNLARCFRCQRNFNPIDLVMAERKCAFVEAVKLLLPYRRSTEPNGQSQLTPEQRPD